MTPQFIIEQDIQREPKHVVVQGKSKYPFRGMKVGASFKFPLAQRSTIAGCAHKFGKATGRRFETRKISDTEGRCWRIE